MVRFIHIRLIDEKGEISLYGGLTVAYDVMKDQIVFATSRCRVPAYTDAGNWDEGDRFNRKLGQMISAGRLKKNGPEDVVPLVDPIQQHLVDYIAATFFEQPVVITRLGKYWVSTFQSELENIVGEFGSSSSTLH